MLKVDPDYVPHYPRDIVVWWCALAENGTIVHPDDLLKMPDGIRDDWAYFSEIKRWLKAKKKAGA